MKNSYPISLAGVMVTVWALSMPAGAATWTSAADGQWSDTSKWDGGALPATGADVVFDKAGSYTTTQDLGAGLSLNGIWFSNAGARLLAGQSLVLNGPGDVSVNTAAGVQATVANDVTANKNFWVNVNDTSMLGLTGAVNYGGNTVLKNGPGRLSFAQKTTGGGTLNIRRGTVESRGHYGWVWMDGADAQSGDTVAFYLMQDGDVHSMRAGASSRSGVTFVFGGKNTSGTTRIGDWMHATGSDPMDMQLYAAAGGTFQVPGFVDNMAPGMRLIKTGGGRLVWSETPSTHSSGTVIANGTFQMNRNANGEGSSFWDWGALGAKGVPVEIGSDLTAATDDLALLGAGDDLRVNHQIVVNNKGRTVTLGTATAQTTLFLDTVTLHRGITLGAQADGQVRFDGNIVRGSGLTGADVFTWGDISKVTFNGTIPDGVALAVPAGKTLGLGKPVVATTFGLGNGAKLEVALDSVATPVVTVTTADGLSLGNSCSLNVKSGNPGRYVLFSYAGALGGSLSNLSIGTLGPGILSATLEQDEVNKQIILNVMSGTFVWTGQDGNWDTGALWGNGVAPTAGGGANIVLRFTNDTAYAANNDMAGTFTVGQMVFGGAGRKTISGNPIRLANPIQQTCDVTISAPLDFNGLSLNKSGTNDLRLTSAFLVDPSGWGYVRGGSLTTRNFNSWMLLRPDVVGETVSFYLDQAGDRISGRVVWASGGNQIFGSRASNGVTRLDDWMHGDWIGGADWGTATYDVAAGGTLNLSQIIGNGSKNVIKAGGGTVEVRDGGANPWDRAYAGTTTLRNGTIRILTDDCGDLGTGPNGPSWTEGAVTNPFNNNVYAGSGGSLGYSALTLAVQMGDAGTLADDRLALTTGDGYYVGHDIVVNAQNMSGTTTLGNDGANTALFAGSITLKKSVVLTGNAVFAGVIKGDVGSPAAGVVKAGAGTVTLSGMNTYSGTTAVSNGTLAVGGSLANAAITVASGATLQGTGTIHCRVSSATNDLIDVQGKAVLSGLTLDLDVTGSLAYGVYVLAQGIGGSQFASVTDLPVKPGTLTKVRYANGRLMLTLSPVGTFISLR